MRGRGIKQELRYFVLFDTFEEAKETYPIVIPSAMCSIDNRCDTAHYLTGSIFCDERRNLAVRKKGVLF